MAPSEITMDESAAWKYLNAARPVRTTLSETLTQIAGFALLAATSKRPPALAEASVIGAQQAAAQASESVRALKPPDLATHHHHHLREAAAGLAHACAQARMCLKPTASRSDRDELLRALRAASEHLRRTTTLIPGFEIIDLGQACCATHAPQRLLCEA